MLGDHNNSDISAHLYPAVHYLYNVLFYLLGRSEALWLVLYLIFKYVISRSLPSPSPSHSAVLAHSSVQLISMASSNSAFLPLCSALCLPPPSSESFLLSQSPLSSTTLSSHSLIFPPLLLLPPMISLLLGQIVLIPFCVAVTKPNSTTPYPSPELKPFVLTYVPSRCSRRHYPGTIISS